MSEVALNADGGRSMDFSFNNVLEGTRQYFMGVPKPVQSEGGQPLWLAGAPLPEEGTTAQSGAPAPSSRPPSSAAAPPSTTGVTQIQAPPRPPSEPLEPEPHIIHKATVMREAAEKRRELPDVEDEEEPIGALSPPSHIIRKPPRTLPSPAPAPAAPCPSPARPPSAAPLSQPLALESQMDHSVQYRAPVHRVQTPTTRPPEHYAPTRPLDPYSASRPPESYPRYHYESSMPDGGRTSQGSHLPSPQPSVPQRQSPQSYARLSGTMPQHTSRLRDTATHSPPAPRYIMPVVQPPPPHNDRVPPIHHPQTASPTQRVAVDGRSSSGYPPLQQRHESSPYGRSSSYERLHAIPPRKYDSQQAYPGYRPSSSTPPVIQNHRIEHQYKHAAMEAISAHYSTRPPERLPPPQQPQTHDSVRQPQRADYVSLIKNIDVRPNCYNYSAPSTSTSRYGPNAALPVVQNPTAPSRSTYRQPSAPKTNYDYSTSNSVPSSPARSLVKPGYPNQSRMTVSVTSLVNELIESKKKRESPVDTPTTQVNQISQTKQKRESPLDLSVKTVKNSADSSTTQDDTVDSVSLEHKTVPLQPRPSSSSRSIRVPTAGFMGSHKVDFAPNFTQYGERSASQSYNVTNHHGHPPVRYNGSYETRRPHVEAYPVESPHRAYQERGQYTAPIVSDEYSRMNVTRPVLDQRHSDSRIRDDRHFIIEDKKRSGGSIVSNIPEKIVRYETWTADSRIDRMNQSAREQKELMSRPVYSYSSHKQFEAYQNEQKRNIPTSGYREHHTHTNHRYPYPVDQSVRNSTDYHAQYHDRNSVVNNRHHVIQKIPSHRDHPHHLDPHSGVPADKRVLSILRNSLETKQTGLVESTKPPRKILDLIVIDDDEITDLTEDNDTELASKNNSQPHQNEIIPNLSHNIQMPKAVDSISRESEYQKYDSPDPKSKSPENDVASRIRTKAELKVMPPSQDNTLKSETKQEQNSESDKIKQLPKSQKQHLFNQIREDNLRLESVVKTEKTLDVIIPEVKTEPMNIDDIERDAEISVKTELVETENVQLTINSPPEDLDWANACDSFMEQLKSGCHKKKNSKKRADTSNSDINDFKTQNHDNVESSLVVAEKSGSESVPTNIIIKQEPRDEDDIEKIDDNEPLSTIVQEAVVKSKDKIEKSTEKLKTDKISERDNEKVSKYKLKTKIKSEKSDTGTSTSSTVTKKESKEKDTKLKNNEVVRTKEKELSKVKDKETTKLKDKEKAQSKEKEIQKYKEDEPLKTIIKEELESTDDDEPLIKSKILKEKEQSDRLKYQLLKDLSEKSAYVKLEFCDVDVNKNSRQSIDSMIKDKDENLSKGKMPRQFLKTKGKSNDNLKHDKQSGEFSSDSDDDVSVATRLRTRKNTKTEDNKVAPTQKTPIKSSPIKKHENNCSTSNSSTPIRKPGFGDGSDFHPGWEEELYRYKRSLRMPTRLIAIPRGRSGGPFVRGTGVLFSRGSTSLPDLDPAPLSPAPSSAPSAATDDLYSRRQDKLTLDSDLDSNSSGSAANRLHYDSEASTSTVFSTNVKRKSSSIVDVLIKKCGRREDAKKKKDKDKDDKTPKVITKKANINELLPTPSLGLIQNGSKGILSAKKEKLMEDIFYLGAFRKETVTAFRNDFIKNTDGLIGATEEFAPVVLKSRTRTESRVLKQRATIKEVFGDERPASAPPISCIDEDNNEEKEIDLVEIKKENDTKPKLKPKKINKEKIKRRSSSIRDGLRSTKSLKRNDAKGRLMRLKKRNNLMMSLNNKRIKMSGNKGKNESTNSMEDKDKSKEEGSSVVTSAVSTKRRLKRLFGRRKFSSGFDYIRKKKKIIRKEESSNKVRRPAVKPNPESVHDIQKEIKGWFINKSIGETHLHRAARLGYTDCVAYCLANMDSDPSAKDNAGFTPLHVAAAKGHVRIARLLLQYGANVSAAANGGIRPLHEACENSHVEVIRLLLAYGADPLLGTYTGQKPEEFTEGPASTLLRLHIADVQGKSIEPWKFPPPSEIIDHEELGCDPLSSPPPSSPPPPPDSTIEIQCTEAPLPPFYSLRAINGQPTDGLWCLLQDVTNLLQIKSKDSLLKQIHCGSGSPKELLREIRTQEFLERAQCHQLLCAGEKVNVRASKVALIRVTDKLRQLLKIETVLVS